MVEVHESLVRRLVTERFPRWAHLPLEPVEPGGWHWPSTRRPIRRRAERARRVVDEVLADQASQA